MHVSKKRHQFIVSILSGALVAVCLVILLAYLGVGAFRLEFKADEKIILQDTEIAEHQFLEEEEVVILEIASTTDDKGIVEEIILPVEKVLFEYVEVIDGCGIHYEGECVNVRGGPGTEYPVVAQLRNGIVLKVGGKVERDGETWYKVVFDEWLRYPERVKGDWYLASEFVEVLLDEGDKTVWENGKATTSKKIIVNRETQTLMAYDGEDLFIELAISTGKELTPTPKGEFSVFKKTPSRYMQGPIPGIAEQYYDMPGVPWNLYFTHGGAVIHGAYWHNSFGTTYSHGCVNLPVKEARTLYTWAELGTKVIVE